MKNKRKQCSLKFQKICICRSVLANFKLCQKGIYFNVKLPFYLYFTLKDQCMHSVCYFRSTHKYLFQHAMNKRVSHTHSKADFPSISILDSCASQNVIRLIDSEEMPLVSTYIRHVWVTNINFFRLLPNYLQCQPINDNFLPTRSSRKQHASSSGEIHMLTAGSVDRNMHVHCKEINQTIY